MSVLLFGASGQVGAHLARQPGVVPISRHMLDFTAIRADDLERLIAEHQPTHLINAAGFTAVDAAETQPELAYAVNAAAPTLIAAVASRHGLGFTHLSTDYVFDGQAGNPYREDARTNPLNQYGRSKLYGEQAALDAGARVFRLQWVFDRRGANFYLTMRRLLAERPRLAIVADQLGAPSYAGHIARALWAARDMPAGIYHLAAAGHTSWHGFACAIAQQMQSTCAIAPITTTEYPTAATRPNDTRLDTSTLAAHGITMPHWRDGLKEVMA